MCSDCKQDASLISFIGSVELSRSASPGWAILREITEPKCFTD